MNAAMAQITLKSDADVTSFKSLPEEAVFVHFNSSVLLAGEYLYYSLYCLNTDQNKFSELSKIAYVELISKEEKVVFKHKIKLESGRGNGDYFIPSTIASGSYKLVAYTNWMRNGKKEHFFQSDIALINPYQGDDSNLISNKSVVLDTLSNFDSIPSFDEEEKISVTPIEEGPIELLIDKRVYGKREKVSMKVLYDEKAQLAFGRYSLSVRKRNQIPEPEKYGATYFMKNTGLTSINYSTDEANSIFLPELRGELFSGWVSAQKDNVSVKNLTVAVSIPGEHYFFQILKTDSRGRFHFSVGKPYSGDKMIFQVLASNAQDYKVKLRESSVDFKEFRFKEVSLDSSMKKVILQRSIHNQIENAFFKYKPDSLKVSSPVQFFDNKEKEIYSLDDYTRFKTLRETITEIIKDVTIKKSSKDDYTILVQGYDNKSSVDLPPLILLDGCYIQDHNFLLEFDARAIEQIKVYKHQFVFGPETFRGAMLIKTGAGFDYNQFNEGGILSIHEVRKPEVNKRYFTQSYEQIDNGQSISPLPDDRLQLVWMPQFQFAEKETEIVFFTSDISGEFDIFLEGFTKNNLPISIKKSITVK